LLLGASTDQTQHGGASPDGDSDEEKAEFKTLLVSERSKADEENFEEALAKAFLAWNKSEVRVGHCRQRDRLPMLMSICRCHLTPKNYWRIHPS
jgi:hypothetical protein